MSPRRADRTVSCTRIDATDRLHDAEAFFEVAEVATNPDVVATNSIHAAIAAADAICCLQLRERSAGGDHAAAVSLLGRVDTKLANTLARSLGRKTQAGYESRSIAKNDAEVCVRQARTLIEAARSRLLAT